MSRLRIIGKDAGAKLTRTLAKVNIPCECYTLPAELGKGGDINDLWIQCEFQRERFVAELHQCKQMEIAIPVANSAASTSAKKAVAVRKKSKPPKVCIAVM